MFKQPGFIAAVIVFLATRLWLLLGFTPLLNGDVLGYFQQAVDGVDLGHAVYRDTLVEYPPLAWWVIALPRWTASQPIYPSFVQLGLLGDFHAEYFARFRLFMAGCDLIGFGLWIAILVRKRPERLVAGSWAYVGLALVFAHIVYDRLDLGLLVTLLAWGLSSIETARRPASLPWRMGRGAALGLGISYKLIPLVMVPVLLTAAIRQWAEIDGRRLRGALALEWGAVAFCALGPFAYYAVVAGSGLSALFTYHAQRGLEVESLWASLLLVARWLGLDVRTEHGFGSINLESPWSSGLLSAASGLLLLLVATGVVRAWLARPAWNDAQATRAGWLTLLAAVLASKVLSVQYLLWVLPIVWLVGLDAQGERSFARLVALGGVIAGLSTAIYPYLFFPQYPQAGQLVTNPWPLAPDLHVVPCLILIVRNLLLAWVVVQVARLKFPSDEPAHFSA